jgi:hypothetical protein
MCAWLRGHRVKRLEALPRRPVAALAEGQECERARDAATRRRGLGCLTMHETKTDPKVERETIIDGASFDKALCTLREVRVNLVLGTIWIDRRRPLPNWFDRLVH